jgi:hypothetical protein
MENSLLLTRRNESQKEIVRASLNVTKDQKSLEDISLGASAKKIVVSTAPRFEMKTETTYGSVKPAIGSEPKIIFLSLQGECA